MHMHSVFCFFFSSRRRHTRCSRDWSSDVCSSDLRVRLAVDAVKEFFLVQKEVAGKHALAVKLFEEITSGDGHLPKRLVGVLRFPGLELGAAFGESLNIKLAKTRSKFWDAHERGCRRIFRGLRLQGGGWQ